ncbi:MAG: helicase associated domain-containing protein [Rubripirellula sp.]
MTGFKLDVWVGTQRQNYRKNKLSDERKRRLDGLGFIWDALAEKWEEGFRELSAYHEKYGYTDLMVDGAPSPHQSDTTLRWLIDRLRS